MRFKSFAMKPVLSNMIPLVWKCNELIKPLFKMFSILYFYSLANNKKKNWSYFAFIGNLLHTQMSLIILFFINNRCRNWLDCVSNIKYLLSGCLRESLSTTFYPHKSETNFITASNWPNSCIHLKPQPKRRFIDIFNWRWPKYISDRETRSF